MPDGPTGRYPGPYQPQQPPVLPDYNYYGSPPVDNEADGWDAVRKVWRRKSLVIGITAAIVLVAAVVTSMMTPRFQTEARVLLGVQDPNVANLQSVLENLVPNSSAVQSEAFVIASREMARQVAYRLALDKSPLFNPELRPEPGWTQMLTPGYIKNQISGVIDQGMEFLGLQDSSSDAGPYAGMTPEQRAKAEEEELWDSIVSRLLYRLTVEPLNRSNVLSVEAESTAPEMAAKIANSFSKIYVEQQLAKRRQATDKANEWLQARIDELRVAVRESERAVEAYRQEHGLFATRSDTIIGQQLAALNQTLTVTENQLAEAQAKLSQAEASKGRGADSLPAVLQSPLILQLRGQQAELERMAADLSANYTSKHPKIRNIQAQISDINAKIDTEIERIIGGLRNEVQIAKNRQQQVSERMRALKLEVGQSNTESVKLRQLEREAAANRTLLESLLQRSKETMQQGELLTSSAEVLSKAAIPSTPSFPPTNLILLMAAMIGVGLGVLLALLVEKLDQTFRTSDEIEEYTGLPTLAVVPNVRRRTAGRLDHVIRNPHSVYANSLRMLSTFLSSNRDARSLAGLVVFTSAVSGEGKSHTSCSLAQLLASEGRRVILLDFDWRQPSQHRLFGQRRQAGVIDLLCGNSSPEDIVYHDEASGADVLFAGDVKLLRGQSVPMERLQLLLHTLSQHYDVIILDTSPTMLTPEVLYLSQIADHVVMNVKWGSTTRRAVTNEIKHILRSGGRVSGIVLNQVDLDRYNKYSYSDGGYLRHGYLIHDA